MFSLSVELFVSVRWNFVVKSWILKSAHHFFSRHKTSKLNRGFSKFRYFSWTFTSPQIVTQDFHPEFILKQWRKRRWKPNPRNRIKTKIVVPPKIGDNPTRQFHCQLWVSPGPRALVGTPESGRSPETGGLRSGDRRKPHCYLRVLLRCNQSVSCGWGSGWVVAGSVLVHCGRTPSRPLPGASLVWALVTG